MASTIFMQKNRQCPTFARALAPNAKVWAMADVAGTPKYGFVTITGHHRRLLEDST
jgi:hypothetical protein